MSGKIAICTLPYAITPIEGGVSITVPEIFEDVPQPVPNESHTFKYTNNNIWQEGWIDDKSRNVYMKTWVWVIVYWKRLDDLNFNLDNGYKIDIDAYGAKGVVKYYTKTGKDLFCGYNIDFLGGHYEGELRYAQW